MFPAPDTTDTTWQDRARDRSLATARRRADDQLNRLLHAAQEMINEDIDPTVPALVARAGMSTKTFYRHFAGRDELLLAVLEEELAIGAHLMRKELDAHDEPVARLRACVVGYVALPGRYRNANVRQARIREAQRLTARYPEQGSHANAPIIAVFRSAIEGVVAAGLVELDDPEWTARSVFHLVTGHLIDAAFDGSPDAYGRIGDHAWRFCCLGLQLSPDADDGRTRPPARRTRNRR